MNADSVHAAPAPSSARLAGARHLARAGALLLGVSLLNGCVIHTAPLPRLALSAHLVGLLGAAFLFSLAALWPHLALGLRWSRIGASLAIYGFVVGWLLYLTAAVTGVAGLFPMAGAGSHGGPVAEGIMSAALLTVAVALFTMLIIVWQHARGTESM